MKIFTVRHGQTAWNAEGRMQGSKDIPLDAAGIAQAQRLAQRLAGEKIDVIYTSDLMRAAKTAEIINTRHNAELVRAEALREVSFGIYEGRLHREVSHEIDRYRALKQPVPGGEDIRDFFARIHSFLDNILAKGHQNIVIVGHHGTCRAAICYFMEMPVESRSRFHVGNTALHCFEKITNGKFVMTVENCTKHNAGFEPHED